MFKANGTTRYRALALALGLALPAASAFGGQTDADCPNGREIALINGRIHTMDASNSVVSAVTMRNGKFVSVGPGISAVTLMPLSFSSSCSDAENASTNAFDAP